ncbi:hypothetical protein S40288_03511 [Stachybotrys chartarum IBT 40288]|nr:hypothetical protein S40288_03511 [Stachybotrys chartarum IBT 40288]
MGQENGDYDVFDHEDHQVAYVFDPDADKDNRERASKRRRKDDSAVVSPPLFVPLLNGLEHSESVELRQTAFQESWAAIDRRIQSTLRDSNATTLDHVNTFVDRADLECMDRIPAAFVITGPNTASQDLLFEQLSERLQQSTSSKFLRMRSSDAVTLKAALKKVIRDVTASLIQDDDDDLQIGQQDRRYLDYDLEALHVFTKTHEFDHIFIAFQDSEGFDSGMLSDLIMLFNSWRPRIPFVLLFGVATSVDLLQARLLKAACRVIYGAQFDVVQTSTILETVFQTAVAACDVPLRLGASTLRGMLDRQHDQVAGIQAFIASLKYAYMSHFFANPLSLLLSADASGADALQAEHLEAIRNLPSFRNSVETSIDRGSSDDLAHAKSLLLDDQYLLAQVKLAIGQKQKWTKRLVRSLLISKAAGAQAGTFPEAYTAAINEGVSVVDQSPISDRVQRLSATELIELLDRVLSLLGEGDVDLALEPSNEAEDVQLQESIRQHLDGMKLLQKIAEEQGFTLHSKYSGQSKVMRTTVIAQRVQLSQDSADLRDEDKQFTEIVDEVIGLLSSTVEVADPKNIFLAESWLYDSKSPLRDVLIPRPRGVFERCLTRPQDYLGCSCCKDEGADIQATSPATPILHHLYLEAGNLINVADLWSAFHAIVSREEEDERAALVMFYRGLAELRALGFIRPSKKKTDHVAKLKWL